MRIPSGFYGKKTDRESTTDRLQYREEAFSGLPLLSLSDNIFTFSPTSQISPWRKTPCYFLNTALMTNQAWAAKARNQP